MSRQGFSPSEITSIKKRVLMPALVGKSVTLEKDGDEYTALCPFHNEDSPSFRVWRDHAHCFGCGWHGDTLDWLTEHERMSFMGALRHLREWAGTAEPVEREIERAAREDNYGWTAILPVPANAPPLVDVGGIVRAYNPKRAGTSWEWTRWRPVLDFAYRDASGALLGYVVRCEYWKDGTRRKFTPPITYCEKNGERRWGVIPLPSPRPIYRLDMLVSRPTATVLLVEGEKTADAAQRLLPSMVAISWANGSKAYRHTDWSPLKGRKVIGIPDADKEGREAFDGRLTTRGKRIPGILEILAGIGANARRVEPPATLSDGWDLADAEVEGWDSARTLAWIRANLVGLADAA
jgi:hypothetical protein